MEKRLCLLCTPTLAYYFAKVHNIRPCLLDIDRRFETETNFKYFDISNPAQLDCDFDIVWCDPPFFQIKMEDI